MGHADFVKMSKIEQNKSLLFLTVSPGSREKPWQEAAILVLALAPNIGGLPQAPE